MEGFTQFPLFLNTWLLCFKSDDKETSIGVDQNYQFLVYNWEINDIEILVVLGLNSRLLSEPLYSEGHGLGWGAISHNSVDKAGWVESHIFVDLFDYHVSRSLVEDLSHSGDYSWNGIDFTCLVEMCGWIGIEWSYEVTS